MTIAPPPHHGIRRPYTDGSGAAMGDTPAGAIRVTTTTSTTAAPAAPDGGAAAVLNTAATTTTIVSAASLPDSSSSPSSVAIGSTARDPFAAVWGEDFEQGTLYRRLGPGREAVVERLSRGELRRIPSEELLAISGVATQSADPDLNFAIF